MLSLLFAACGLYGDLPPLPTPTPASSDFLQNPGFELGGAPWRLDYSNGTGSASFSNERARSGKSSLALSFSADALPEAGASQVVPAAPFPEFVSGFCRVDRWRPDGAMQFVEFVITVRGAGFPDGAAEHSLHFAIAGAAHEPGAASSGSFVFLSRDPPKTGAWVYFGYPVRQAFEARFGSPPAQLDTLEVAVDVTAEDATPQTNAEVYFDDIYAGPQAENPNRPPDQ